MGMESEGMPSPNFPISVKFGNKVKIFDASKCGTRQGAQNRSGFWFKRVKLSANETMKFHPHSLPYPQSFAQWPRDGAHAAAGCGLLAAGLLPFAHCCLIKP